MFDVNKIVNVDNFITQEDANILIHYGENLVHSPKFDKPEYKASHRLCFPFPSMSDKVISDIMVKFEQQVWTYISTEYVKLFNARAGNIEWHRDLELVRWSHHGLQAHRDGHEAIPDWEKVKDSRLSVSALIYLTDDFKGGDLVFEDFDYSFKPKALSLGIFPSYYSHSVSEIFMNNTKTPRYTIPFFYGFNVKQLNDAYYDPKDLSQYEYYRIRILGKF
jgi:hypothetical protein